MGRRARIPGTAGARRGLVLIVVLLSFTGWFGFLVVGDTPTVHGGPWPVARGTGASDSNGSGGADPPESSASATLCPTSGPTILGIEWNCVAILNLTELALILASVGIVAYVFRDADRAELPGEAREVPVTAEEWDDYRRKRDQGIPYGPVSPDPAERKP